MEFDVQSLIALLVVATAAAYLLGRLLRRRGGCGDCPSKSCSTNDGQTLVNIEPQRPK